MNCSGRSSRLTLWPTGHSRYWMLFHVSNVSEGNLLKVHCAACCCHLQEKVVSYPISVKPDGCALTVLAITSIERRS